MKFSLIPHFIVGLYMYTNSTIITPTDIKSKFLDYINVNNEYLNNVRFANVTSAIFIATFAFIFLFYILRMTLYMFFKKVFSCCCSKLKELAKQILTSSKISEDFYKDITPLQLCKEYNKTTIEKRDYQRVLKVGQRRKENESEM